MPLLVSDAPPTRWQVNGDRPGDTWARQAFSGCVDQVSMARRFVSSLLGQCPQVEEIVLVANELVCNAIRHTRSGQLGGVYLLDIRCAANTVEIAVSDQGGTEQDPVLRTLEESYDELAFHGRGLLTVAGLASDWGWRGNCAGRVVWAEFRTGVDGVVSEVLGEHRHGLQSQPGFGPEQPYWVAP